MSEVSAVRLSTESYQIDIRLDDTDEAHEARMDQIVEVQNDETLTVDQKEKIIDFIENLDADIQQPGVTQLTEDEVSEIWGELDEKVGVAIVCIAADPSNVDTVDMNVARELLGDLMNRLFNVLLDLNEIQNEMAALMEQDSLQGTMNTLEHNMNAAELEKKAAKLEKEAADIKATCTIVAGSIQVVGGIGSMVPGVGTGIGQVGQGASSIVTGIGDLLAAEKTYDAKILTSDAHMQQAMAQTSTTMASKMESTAQSLRQSLRSILSSFTDLAKGMNQATLGIASNISR
ncbi:MAG: hypothetical protein LBT98_01925 [Puniceicoccales bacterium]|jgi:hypothetical protein|nr:hypothetical protein [Puniceicoccales bacterium]